MLQGTPPPPPAHLPRQGEVLHPELGAELPEPGGEAGGKRAENKRSPFWLIHVNFSGRGALMSVQRLCFPPPGVYFVDADSFPQKPETKVGLPASERVNGSLAIAPVESKRVSAGE